MKKFLIVLTGLFLIAGSVYADSLHSVKETGDLTVKMVSETNPLKVGDNHITIELADLKGKAIKGAEVSVYYFMPSMPAMNYEAGAELDGTKYVAVIRPTMPGAWDADIKVIKAAGEEMQKVRVSFKAR